MKKVYLDVTEETECIGVIVGGAEVIRAGTTIFSMPVNQNNGLYQRYADEYDIHFIFNNIIPNIDFYTVPQVDIMAVDSNGGLIGTIGQQTDFESDAPICYIDENRACYLIALDGAAFLKNVSNWKADLIPYDDVAFYSSKSVAESELEFIDIKNFKTNLTK